MTIVCFKKWCAKELAVRIVTPTFRAKIDIFVSKFLSHRIDDMLEWNTVHYLFPSFLNDLQNIVQELQVEKLQQRLMVSQERRKLPH